VPAVPELKQRPYEHQRPHRPSHLARRTKPPPERAAPPDLTLFIYAGLALAVIVMLLAIPYLLQYLATILTS
jgi:hypothetical protein